MTQSDFKFIQKNYSTKLEFVHLLDGEAKFNNKSFIEDVDDLIQVWIKVDSGTEFTKVMTVSRLYGQNITNIDYEK